MLIRGIRSFDPNDTNVIEFYTPLTLIVGHNGSGKTTIIECLKYATTGDLPPNSKNGAFIHDPKIAHETEVLAQIKLRFRNINGQEMVVTRSMSLTQKKGGVTQKTLEGLLVHKDDRGGTSSFSSKCGELDAELSNNLGVSKAILENVIFCHQEDSLWPLSEPSVLKKKFDEIFASTRYTKVLDNIKSIRKEQNIQFKIDEASLVHLKSDKEKAAKIRNQCKRTNSQIKVARERIEKLEEVGIDEVQKQMSEIFEAQQTFGQLKNRKVELENEIERVQKNIENITAYLDGKESDESDEILQKKLDASYQNMNENTSKISNLDSQNKKISAEISSCEEKLSEKRLHEGKLLAEKEAQERRIVDRSSLIFELSRKHNFLGFNDAEFITVDDFEKFMERLKAEIKDKSEAHESITRQMKEAENKLLEELQKLKSNYAKFEESKKNNKKFIDISKQKTNEYTLKIKKIQVTQHDIDDMEQKLAQEERNLQLFMESFSQFDNEAKSKKLQNELVEIEWKSNEISGRLGLLNLQVESRAKINLKKAERDGKESNLKRSLQDAENEFVALLGHMPSLNEIERELELKLREKEAFLKREEDALHIANKELSGYETRISMAKSNLQKSRATLIERKSLISQNCEDGDYLAAKAKASKEVDEKKEVLMQLMSATAMYRKFLMKFEGKKECPLCNRCFELENDNINFRNMLKNILASIPANIKISELALETAVEKNKTIGGLQTAWDDIERILIEITETEKRLIDNEASKALKENCILDMNNEISLVQAELQEIKNLSAKAKEFCRLDRDLKNINNELKKLLDELANDDNSISGESVEEAQHQLDLNNKKCSEIRRDIDKLNLESRNKQSSLVQLEQKVRNLKEDTQNLKFEFKEVERLKKGLEEVKVESEKSFKENEKIEQALFELSPRINQTEEELTMLRSKSSRDDREALMALNNLQQSENQINSVQRDIVRYINSGGDELFKSCQLELESLQQKHKLLQNSRNKVIDNIAAINQEVNRIELIRETLKKNLELRQQKKNFKETEAEVKNLEDSLKSYDTDNLNEKYKRLKKKHESLVDERAGLVGELKQLEDQLKRMELELENDYKDIDQKFHDHNVKLKMDTLANADLERYAKALDGAIMKYHSLKMEEINKIIKELWGNTYQGLDIDTVEIRADNENTKGGRSYNYRVVMIKRDTELDMRGRCSAGQKVLASLIIRLTLAETFGLNCGILALDEPTTNLDKTNIESLAVSLGRIIATRRQQSNFQLVIITHDEEFLQALGKTEFADYYFRVFKDEHGLSQIEREAIVKRIL